MKKFIICVLVLVLTINVYCGAREVKELRAELESTKEELTECREERDNAVKAQQFLQNTLVAAKESKCAAVETHSN